VPLHWLREVCADAVREFTTNSIEMSDVLSRSARSVLGRLRLTDGVMLTLFSGDVRNGGGGSTGRTSAACLRALVE
jgi:hypothetical protein